MTTLSFYLVGKVKMGGENVAEDRRRERIQEDLMMVDEDRERTGG